VIGLGDRSVRTYDVVSGKESKRYALKAPPYWMALHPDGRKLAVAMEYPSSLQLLDLETGELQTIPHDDVIRGIAWHPSGKLLAGACANRKVYLWSTDGTVKPHAILTGHQNVVTNCSFNHGGDVLASYGWDGMTRLWDPIAGKELVSIPGYFVHFSPDDRFLAYSRGELGLWEVATGRECRSLHAFAQKVHGPWTVAFHPDGRLLASTNNDGPRLWDVPKGKEVERLPPGNGRVFFGPSGDWLLTSGEHGIQRWPLATNPNDGTARCGPPQTIRDPLGVGPAVALSADGRWLAALAGTQQAVVVDLEKPTEKVLLHGHPKVSDLNISPDGRWVVTGTQHGSGIKVWDAKSGKVVRDLPAGGYSGGVFSPDGKWLATTSNGHGTDIREVGSWEMRHHLSKERSSGMAFAKDSSLLALSYEIGTVVLVEPVNGQEVARLPAPNPLPSGGMCFSDDGAQLAVACYNHQTIQLWDLRAIRARLKAMKLDWDARN
jgi:WD40 repeat protein